MVNRRFIAIFVVAVTATAGLAVLPANPAAGTSHVRYIDVPAGVYFSEPIETLAESGVFDGTDCGHHRFCPNDGLLRWQVAVWLVRLLDGDDPTALATGRFRDVPSSVWYAPHVERLFEIGVTTGCGDNDFCPQGTVTRAQMATFLDRALGLPESQQNRFADVPSGVWYTKPVAALAASGITTGCDSSLFCPNDTTTKGQMATFLRRAQRAGFLSSNTTVDPPDTTVDSCEWVDVVDATTAAVWQVHAGNSIGTAFYIGDDEWLTAAHVVEGVASVTLANEGKTLEAEILGGDLSKDIAVLSASGAGITPLAFAADGAVKRGQDLWAVGYPLVVARQSSVTKGAFTRTTHDSELGDLIITDTAVNGGNSGGPLVDECGDVVGMIISKLVHEAIDGIAFAIASGTLREHYQNLRDGGSESIAPVAKRYENCYNDGTSEWSSVCSDAPEGWWFVAESHPDGQTLAWASVDASWWLKSNVVCDETPCGSAPQLQLWCYNYETDHGSATVDAYWGDGITVGSVGDEHTVVYSLHAQNRESDAWTVFANDEDASFVGDDVAERIMSDIRSGQSILNTSATEAAWAIDVWVNNTDGDRVLFARFPLDGADRAFGFLEQQCESFTIQPTTPTREEYEYPYEPGRWGTGGHLYDDGSYATVAFVNTPDRKARLSVVCLERTDGSRRFTVGMQETSVPDAALVNVPQWFTSPYALDHAATFIVSFADDFARRLQASPNYLTVNWHYSWDTTLTSPAATATFSLTGFARDAEPVLARCGY